VKIFTAHFGPRQISERVPVPEQAHDLRLHANVQAAQVAELKAKEIPGPRLVPPGGFQSDQLFANLVNGGDHY